MSISVNQDPFGWVHPFYRQRPFVDFDSFIQPALETVDTLNQLIQLAQQGDLLTPEEESSDKFEVKVDVQQFAPNELDVKMVDNCVVIEGKHEDKKDEQGFISRHFVTRYQLPDDVKPEMVTCNLSSDGVLSISAPRMIEDKKTNERPVPIHFTGKPAVTNKDKCCQDREQCKKTRGSCPCEMAEKQKSNGGGKDGEEPKANSA